MRISDDRYNRDRLRFDLALRMMRHEARNCTIRLLTGLSEDRIRKLYRSYLLHRPTGTPIRRHRGKSPRQPTVFLQTAALNFEATTLASMFCVAGLIPRAPALPPTEGKSPGTPDTMLTLKQAEEFCEAYEGYLVLHDPPRISFEYAWFLLVSLFTQESIRLAKCGQCTRMYIDEAECIEAASCGCVRNRSGWQRGGRLPARIVQAYGN